MSKKDESAAPNVAQAAAEIGNMVRAFRAFRDAENVLAVLQGHDQLSREAEARSAAARDEASKAQAELEDAKAELAKARQAAKDVASKAEAKAAGIVAEAEAKAAALMADAGVAAEKAAAERRASSDAELSTLDAAITAGREELAGLQSRIAEKRALLAKVAA